MNTDLDFLVMHVTGLSRSFLYAHPDFEFTPQQQAELSDLQRRLAAGEPLAYLLGEQGFRSLLLKVTPAVLIPRPETEMLVEAALELLALTGLPQSDSTTQVLELGTGSGAIALALASEAFNCSIIATDNCTAALSLAAENRQINPPKAGSSVTFCLSDWYLSVAGHFDVIVANPPYVAGNDPDLELNVICHEPRSAVIAEELGLADLRHIIQGAPAYLKPQGWLLLEHGWKQGFEVRKQLEQAGFQRIETRRDLAGNERMSLGKRP